MLSYYPTFVSASAYALTAVIGNDLQTGILITLGSLLFVFGTVLRRKLPIPYETTSSHPHTLWVDAVPPNTYVRTVASVANTATSRKHANAV
jgi:hypothetical protein